jgi:hypothetical protein
VIVLSAEDGAADTIVPRLMAAGADLSKVHIVSAVQTGDGKGRRSFNLQADLQLLEKKIEEVRDIALVIVDPVSSYMGKTDSHKNADVRGVLGPVGEMADRMRIAVLSITHFAKTGAGGNTKALHRFIGSIAFVADARAAFVVTEDPDDPDRKLILHAKNNLVSAPQGLAFRLQQKIVGDPGNGIVASRVEWERDPVTITADAAIAAGSGTEGRSAREEAMDFLKQALAQGPVDVTEINKQADALGISERTLKRARSDLGVRARRSGGLGSEGEWVLLLPWAPGDNVIHFPNTGNDS